MISYVKEISNLNNTGKIYDWVGKMQKLDGSCNPAEARDSIWLHASDLETTKIVSYCSSSVYSMATVNAPEIALEALKGPEKEKWKESIRKEAMHFISRKC
jgi:hypothetical protein